MRLLCKKALPFALLMQEPPHFCTLKKNREAGIAAAGAIFHKGRKPKNHLQ
jgi:hypothetical protein